MRILVVGAGAIGGYFGARLAAAGRDVTFLVRPRRAEQLALSGLMVRSRHGDVRIPDPKLVTEATLRDSFDLVLLSLKSFDLEGALGSFARAIGPETGILPMLNGMAHIELLQKRFGAGAVLGGECQISATLDDEGHIVHLNDWHSLSFGELDGARSARFEAITTAFADAGFESRPSLNVRQAMWDKWVFIATLAMC